MSQWCCGITKQFHVDFIPFRFFILPPFFYYINWGYSCVHHLNEQLLLAVCFLCVYLYNYCNSFLCTQNEWINISADCAILNIFFLHYKRNDDGKTKIAFFHPSRWNPSSHLRLISSWSFFFRLSFMQFKYMAKATEMKN
jgi:hypothetical protein